MKPPRLAAALLPCILAMAARGGAEPIFVTGKVHDARGRAIAGARIEMAPLTRSYERHRLTLAGLPGPEPVSAAVSDGAGFFSLAAPDAGMWTIRVTAPGFLPGRLELTPLLEPLVLPPVELQPGEGPRAGGPVAPGRSVAAPRTVEVRDAAGQPVAGALVSSQDGREALGLTGEGGVLGVAVPAGRELRLLAETADGRRGQARLRAGTAPVRIVLAPGPRLLKGRVLDRLTGKPIVGAFVWPSQDAGAAVRTDPAGAYTLVDPQQDLAAAAVRHLPAEAAVRRQAAKAPAGPDFLLSPAAAVAGSVVDPGGRPLEGVELEAEPAGAGLPGSRLRARSDPRGRFFLGGLDPSRAWELRAIRRGFLPASLALADLKPLASRSGLRIVLRPGRPASGTVVDEAGRPVVGAEVSLLPAEESGEPDFASRRELVARTTSDAEGRFELDTPPAARVDLEARAAGFVPALVRGLAVPPGKGSLDLGRVVLAAGETLEGRVEDPQGQPLHAAAISVQRADPTAARLAWAGFPPRDSETVTDADGRFELKGLRPGEPVSLLIRCEGYASRTVPGLRPPFEEPVRVVLSPTSRLSGRILDEQGEPIASAQVALRREDGTPGFGVGSADAEGRFTLEEVLPGRFTLDVSAQGHLPTRVEGIETSPGVDQNDLEVILSRGAALEGTVYAPDGTPAPGARVRALPSVGSGPAPLSVVPETRADGDGRYRLEGLREGRQAVVAEHPAYQKAVQELAIREEETRLDLRLGEAREVAGRTVDSGGRGIVGVRVGLAAADGEEQETLSGPDGGFRFTSVGEGRHRLRAEKQGYARPPVREIQVAGGPVRDLELRLDPGIGLSGRILGLSSQDLVRVQVAATQPGVTAEPSGRADDQGRYRIGDLAPGDWTVLARLPDGRLAEGQVTVPAGVREVTLDLEFESGLSLSGRVLAGTTPVSGALLHLRSPEGSGGAGRSGPEGEFRIEGLKPGSYTLLVIAPQNGLRREESLELQADRQVVIELRPSTPSAVDD